MRSLIACEESGVVRRAFRAMGADAWSCDLLPARDGSPHHYQGDAIGLLNKGWDMLIAHPPCTYLCNSGVRWLSPGGKLNQQRFGQMVAAADFFAALFAALFAAPIERIAIENPIMHGHARRYLQETWRCLRHDAGPTQIIQPWQHGHGETKATCLWLKNLPLLKPSNIVEGRAARIHRMAPGPNRARERSVTFKGIAKAMASQWLNI